MTDYTVNHYLYKGQVLRSILYDGDFEGRDVAWDLAAGHRLLPVGFFGLFAEMAAKFQVGQFYRLRNLLLRPNQYKNLQGRVDAFHGPFESKDVQRITPSADDDQFLAFLE